MGWISNQIKKGIVEGIDAVDWPAVSKQIVDSIDVDALTEKVIVAIGESENFGRLTDGMGNVISAKIKEAIGGAVGGGMGGGIMQLIGGLFGGGGQGGGGAGGLPPVKGR